jgi:hypothetical protein
LISAATLTRKTKPFNKVSSIRGENTLLQGSRIKTEADQQRSRRQINRQIKAADPRRDQHRSEKTRSKEIKGPEQRNQDRSETRRQRVRAHFKKRDCSDDL